ncbi:membrane anchor subunit of succinate dehydrogenase, Sdh4 [Lithohypha guttulata]|uniref:membrane anchor subunit of succinate dehydrogenase, Sdh4 n=1 Tax=Lithohypha guttulata TaxID=1690604 RepID=UPI002DE038DF|nr:membrane anchor subunit of succinate dehydrogenase, Sdh4 [Lithohypha guttulata]KAK5105093.1 membrane anchor subunit of succinate dehydrogenase, Sdh4 [Lithohypha guttulata]
MASTTRLGMRCARQLFQPARRVVLRPEHIRQSSPIVSRLAPFTTTTKKSILPPGPQVVHGGVNDPAPVPDPHPTHGSYHWIAERGISVLLVPLTLAPFAAGTLNPTMDAIFCGAMLIHSHLGFQSIITDYVPQWRMPGVRKAFDYLLMLATLVVGIGLYEFETNDVGITEAVKRIWRAGKNDATIEKSNLSGLGYDAKALKGQA